MMKWFRRQRLLAALLILANPALVGSWVAAYHPCPVQDALVVAQSEAPPVVATDEHAGHEGMMMAETAPSSHDHSQNEGHCSCIGQCLTAGIALPLETGLGSRFAVVITSAEARVPQSALTLPVSAPLDLLPPSTAPPTA